MTGSMTRRTLKGVAWLSGASLVRLALRVISVGILARLLTPGEYGIAAGALVALDLAGVISTLGLSTTVVHHQNLRPEHVATATSVTLTLGVVAGLGIFFGAPLLSAAMRTPELVAVLQVLAFLAPFASLNALCESLLARNLETRSLALRPLFSFIVASFLVGVPLAYAGFSYWSLVWMQVAEVVFSSALLITVSRKFLVFPRFSRQAFIDMWPSSLGFSLNMPFEYAFANIDQFLIVRWLGVESLGLYSRSSFLVKNATTLFGAIARSAMFPTLAKLQDDRTRLRSGMLKSLALTAMACLPFSAYAVVCADEIIRVMLGPNWDSAVLPFALLSLTLYFRLNRRAVYALFQALGRAYFMLWLHGTSILALALGIWIARPYGLVGVCVAVLLAMVLTFIVSTLVLVRSIRLPLHDIAAVHVRPLFVAAIVAVVASCVKLVLPPFGAIVTLAATSVTSAIVLAIVLFSRPTWVLDRHAAEVVAKMVPAGRLGRLAPFSGRA